MGFAEMGGGGECGGGGWEKEDGGWVVDYCVLCCLCAHPCKHWMVAVNVDFCNVLFKPLGGILGYLQPIKRITSKNNNTS